MPEVEEDPAVPLRPHERVERVGGLFRRLLLLAAVALLGWAGAVAAMSREVAGAKSDIEAVIGAECAYDRRSDQGRAHVTEPIYRIEPPSGGPHVVTPASGGFKEFDSVPTDGELVHAMEHGAVVVWYSGALDADDEQALRELADSDRAVIVVPRSALGVPLAVTAWHRRMLCEVVDTEAVARFSATFRGRGPERVGL